MQADLSLETIPSYVNISSSVLRNKFEQNRAKTLQRLANDSDALNNNSVNVEKLKHAVVEKFIKTEEKINNIVIASKATEERLTTFISDLQLNNEKTFDNLSDNLKKLELSITDLNFRFEAFSNDQPLMTSGISEDRLSKVNSLSLFIDEMQTKLNTLSNRFEENILDEKIKVINESFQKKFDELERKMDSDINNIIENVLPKDFDPIIYRIFNNDLKHYNDQELKRHYVMFGIKENRTYSYKKKQLPPDFNWNEYLQMNIDLAIAIKNEEQAITHYFEFGMIEKRMYKMEQLETVNFFVYSGRKSGSSTLNYSCLNLDKVVSIQIHNNEDFLYKHGQCKFNSIFELVENNMKKHKKIYVIDSYRTPIEKKISSFFQDIDHYVPNYRDCEINYLISYFNKKYIYAKNCTHIYTEDYEPLDEMMEHFKLPALKTFDCHNKFSLVQYKNLTFIKVRFHEIKIWGELLTKILGRKVVILNQNVSETKDYNDVYEKFKEQYKIPKEFLEKLKKDTRFNIYNSKTEQIKYIKDWMAKSI